MQEDQDLAKFDIALDEGRLISAESRERMWTPAASNGGKALPYALGWFVEEFAGRKAMPATDTWQNP